MLCRWKTKHGLPSPKWKWFPTQLFSYRAMWLHLLLRWKGTVAYRLRLFDLALFLADFALFDLALFLADFALFDLALFLAGRALAAWACACTARSATKTWSIIILTVHQQFSSKVFGMRENQPTLNIQKVLKTQTVLYIYIYTPMRHTLTKNGWCGLILGWHH